MFGQLLALALTTTLLVAPLGGAAVADPGSDVTAVTTTPAGPAAAPDPVKDLAKDPATRAAQALDGAHKLFSPRVTAPRARARGPVQTPSRDGTLVLRELALRVHDLASPAARHEARQILSRPTDGSTAVGGEPKYTVPASVACTATSACTGWRTT